MQIKYYELQLENLRYIFSREIFGTGHYCQTQQKYILENVNNWGGKIPDDNCNSYFTKREHLVVGTIYFKNEKKYVQLLIDNTKPLIFDSECDLQLINLAKDMHEVGKNFTLQDLVDNPPKILQDINNQSYNPNN